MVSLAKNISYAPATFSLENSALVRERQGYVIEYVLIIYVLIFALVLPLFDLCTTALRVVPLIAITRSAAFSASRTQSFLINVSPSQLSATNAARNTVLSGAAAFTGISINSVTTNLLVTNVATLNLTRQRTPLAHAPNTNTYVYQIEVVVSASVRPLFLFSTSCLGNTPGLTQPIPLSVSAREFCEYPQGLTM